MGEAVGFLTRCWAGGHSALHRPESRGRSATRGGGGARLRQAGADAGEEREGAERVELTAAISETLIEEEPLKRGSRSSARRSRRTTRADLLLVGVLKGAVFFKSDLMRHLTVTCEIDFMAISSYAGATESSGVVRILSDLDMSIEGRTCSSSRTSSTRV